RLVDFRAVAAGAIEKETSENALRVVEIGTGSGDIAKGGFGRVGTRRVDEDHRALELQDRISGIARRDLVDARDRFVVSPILRGKFGEDEFVRIFGKLLGHRRRAENTREGQNEEELLHCLHGITRKFGTSGRWTALHTYDVMSCSPFHASRRRIEELC